MPLNLTNTVVELLQQNPEKKFTAREIADWIFETYPDECRQKQKRSTATINPLDNEKALLQQIVSEIGSQRPSLQKKHPKVKTTEGRPRKYYYTEQSDADEVEDIEQKALETQSIAPEHDLYPMLMNTLMRSIIYMLSALMRNTRLIIVAKTAISGCIRILLLWKT